MVISFTRSIPAGGEGTVSIKLNTQGYGGKTITKSSKAYTNDQRNKEINLTLAGPVEAFADITPSQVQFNGPMGTAMKQRVMIFPKKERPFKITGSKAREGRYLRFELKETTDDSGRAGYIVDVENLKTDVGNYYDNIFLEIDSPIQPKLDLRVYGNIIYPGASPGTGKLLDMTYAFDENTIYWPTAESFKLEKLNRGTSEGGWWYASNNYRASEHGGTHADAPIHFSEKGRTIDQIPLPDWIGNAVKIDVVAKCLSNRDYLLTTEDITQWEAKYGRIPDNAWVLMYTGIGTKDYPDREKVLGTAKTGKNALPELSFPGFSAEAVEFLINSRNIKGIGLDTPSIDQGKSKDFKAHRICCAANKLAIENIANLDKLPAKGAVLYVIPMLIKDGTGAPARVFAVLP